MDSFPQELIDEIIDNVPDFSLPSCSLVARRWRRQSQQRALNSIEFSSEDEVYSWWTDIPQGTGGVVSYVRSVHFVEIYSWDEPALFGRVLKNFTSLRELIIARTEIPDELPGHISGGEFRNGITNLCLWFPRCTLATIVSMILLPPNLKELAVDNKRAVLDDDEPLPTHSVMSRRKQLDLLELGGDANGIGEVLAEYRFIASRLHLQLCVPETAQLLTLSSEVVVELHLCDTPNGVILPPVPIPPLPALTTLVIEFCMDVPSPRLTNILRSIGSAPALTSVTLGHHSWGFVDAIQLAGPWDDVDRWLSRIVKHGGSLLLKLMLWPRGKSIREEFLHRFRASGGDIRPK